MMIEIKKERNHYSKNYYILSIQTNAKLTAEDYKTITDSMEAIAKIIDPAIDKEIEETKKKKEAEKPNVR